MASGAPAANVKSAARDPILRPAQPIGIYDLEFRGDAEHASDHVFGRVLGTGTRRFHN